MLSEGQLPWAQHPKGLPIFYHRRHPALPCPSSGPHFAISSRHLGSHTEGKAIPVGPSPSRAVSCSPVLPLCRSRILAPISVWTWARTTGEESLSSCMSATTSAAISTLSTHHRGTSATTLESSCVYMPVGARSALGAVSSLAKTAECPRTRSGN